MRRTIWVLSMQTVEVSSAASSRDEYLRRPDYGRRLSDVARDALQAVAPADAVDLCLMIGDGLSSAAVHAHAVAFVEALKPWFDSAGWSLAPVALASQARVALGDEVGEILKARLVVVLIGERPGLSSPDSLGIYVTHTPRLGRNDAERNCISNVRPEGLSYDVAAFKLAWLMDQALVRGITGVKLKDDSDTLLENGKPPKALPKGG